MWRAFDLAYYIYFASYFHVPADEWEEPDENNYYLPDDQIEEFLSIYLETLSDGTSSEEEIIEEFNMHTAYVILRKLYDDFPGQMTSSDITYVEFFFQSKLQWMDFTVPNIFIN